MGVLERRQRWTVFTLDIFGTILGIIWLARRWALSPSPGGRDWTARSPAISTAGFLIYSLIAAAIPNRRLTSSGAFRPLSHLAWLPHSYDRSASWLAFWQNLALAGTFWATRAWLLNGPATSAGLLPKRARALLMFMVTNGFLLAVIALLQRLDKTQELLWLVKPHINQWSGAIRPVRISWQRPGIYRPPLAPGAGSWSMYSGAQRRERLLGRRSWLLLCSLTMAACPFLWESRLAAVIDAAILLLAPGFLLVMISGRPAAGRGADSVGRSDHLGLGVEWARASGTILRSGPGHTWAGRIVESRLGHVFRSLAPWRRTGRLWLICTLFTGRTFIPRGWFKCTAIGCKLWRLMGFSVPRFSALAWPPCFFHRANPATCRPETVSSFWLQWV